MQNISQAQRMSESTRNPGMSRTPAIGCSTRECFYNCTINWVLSPSINLPQDQCIASSVLHLAPRFSSLHRGCSVPIMERTSSLSFSFICPNHPLFSEDTGEGIQCRTDSTSLAQSMVPINSRMSQRLPNPSTPIPKIQTVPVGEDHPMVLEGHLPLSHLTHLRRSFVAEGLSEGVINLISSS